MVLEKQLFTCKDKNCFLSLPYKKINSVDSGKNIINEEEQEEGGRDLL